MALTQGLTPVAPPAPVAVAATAPVHLGPGVDHYQIWSSIAYAYLACGDETLLHRAQEMLGGSLAGSLASDQLENLPNRAALLALVQQLGIQY